MTPSSLDEEHFRVASYSVGGLEVEPVGQVELGIFNQFEAINRPSAWAKGWNLVQMTEELMRGARGSIRQLSEK